MGGVLFSNFYFHSHSENKGKNKRKVPLELLGELAYLLSVLSVGRKDLSANNLFQCSLFSIPQHVQRLLVVEFQMINTVHLLNVEGGNLLHRKMQKALCLIHLLM